MEEQEDGEEERTKLKNSWLVQEAYTFILIQGVVDFLLRLVDKKSLFYCLSSQVSRHMSMIISLDHYTSVLPS